MNHMLGQLVTGTPQLHKHKTHTLNCNDKIMVKEQEKDLVETTNTEYNDKKYIDPFVIVRFCLFNTTEHQWKCVCRNIK